LINDPLNQFGATSLHEAEVEEYFSKTIGVACIKKKLMIQNDTSWTIFEPLTDPSKPEECYILTRGSHGKFCWKVTPAWSASEKKEKVDDLVPPAGTKGLGGKFESSFPPEVPICIKKKMSEQESSVLHDQMRHTMNKMSNSILSEPDDQQSSFHKKTRLFSKLKEEKRTEELLAKFNEQRKSMQASKVRKLKEENVEDGEGKRVKNSPKEMRRLLSLLGMVPSPGRKSIAVSNIDHKNVDPLLLKMDNLPVRHTYQVSVLYRDGDQMSDMTMLENKIHSEEFQEFVFSVTHPVDLSEHTGFSGQLTEEDTEIVPYYSHYNYELVLHVPSLCATTDHNRRRQLYETCAVRIIWSDSQKPMQLSTKFQASSFIGTKGNHQQRPRSSFKESSKPILYIRINPQSGGLHRVRLHYNADNATQTQDDVIWSSLAPPLPPTKARRGERLEPDVDPQDIFGPLVDQMLVSEELLPDLIRHTIANAHLHIKADVQNEKIKTSLDNRKALFDDLRKCGVSTSQETTFDVEFFRSFSQR